MAHHTPHHAPYNTLRLETEGELAVITLNRPEKRNAISPEMVGELTEALEAAESGAARVVILAGAGKSFCSGMDLGDLQQLGKKTPEENLAEGRRVARMFRKLWGCRKPVIAAVQGAALAGGFGLASLCDFTVAAEDAKFGYTEVRIGFMPALVSMYLARQVGEKRARDLLLTGRTFGAAEAQALGLVNEVVPGDRLMEAARGLAARLLENSSGSLEATKRLLLEPDEAELDRLTESALASSVAIRSTADFREGLAAFLEKRKPNWSHPPGPKKS